MTAFANRMKALASRLTDVKKFGKVIATFTRDLNDGIDPTTLEADESNKTTYTAKCAPIDIISAAKMITAMGVSSGDLTIGQDEKLLYIEAGTLPIRGDTVSLDGEDWKIRTVEVFEVQNIHCAYLLKIGK